MPMRSVLTKSLAVAFVFLMAATFVLASEQGHFEKTLQVSGAPDLEVLTRSGNVIVHGGSAGQISIIGRIHVGDRWFTGGRKGDVEAIEKNPPITQSGNSVRIDYVNYNNISIDYEISAPADTRLRAKSGSGDLTFEGTKAGVDAETGSGNVRLRDLAGNLRIHTGSGNVEIRGMDGALRATAGSGDIRVDGRPSSSWTVRTGSGNADLRLPQEVAFDVDLTTSSGSIVV